jgi:hypothetical protein
MGCSKCEADRMYQKFSVARLQLCANGLSGSV